MPTAEIISLVIAGLEEGVPYVIKLIDAAKQKGELTPEQEAAFDSRIKAFQDPTTKPEHWKTDSERGLI